MNVHLLIDSVVRQTTVLIAQLATAGGARTPLARVAHQVFFDLAGELEAQGLSRQVTADMFGISLRSYQRKVHRVRESRTERGRTLWEAVYEHLCERGLVARREVLERFRRDDPQSVRSILRDLVESGLAFMSGSGDDALYRAAERDEIDRQAEPDRRRSSDALLWALIYREGPLTRAQLLERFALEGDALDAALGRLRAAGHVAAEERAPETLYRSERLLVELGAGAGWEAAVYDHFQAVVRTICARLDPDTVREGYRDYTGGSTYSLDISPSHPLRDEVFSTLARLRVELGALRRRVNAHNEHDAIGAVRERVVLYVGQCVLPEGEPAAPNDDAKEESE
jgi:hypothetical protein